MFHTPETESDIYEQNQLPLSLSSNTNTITLKIRNICLGTIGSMKK